MKDHFLAKNELFASDCRYFIFQPNEKILLRRNMYEQRFKLLYSNKLLLL